MKEELLARAGELARECRGHYDHIREQMNVRGSLEKVSEADLASLTECIKRLWDFCEPLVITSIFIPEEVGVLVDYAIPELEAFLGKTTGLPAAVANFIEKELPGLDNF